MQKVRVPINSFQFGEVSPSTLMRTDSAIYNASAQKLQNMMVLAEGAVKKRPGLKHHYKYTNISLEVDGAGSSHLFEFHFSDDERYIISIEHQRARCFRLEDGAVTLVETITQDTNSDPLPFDRDYLAEYSASQYGDVMIVTHPLFMPRMVIRTGLTSFEITPFSFDSGIGGKQTFQPYSLFRPQGVTLDPSASTGTSITLTTSEPYWVADHVGTVVRYHESEIEITGYTSSTVVTGDIVDELRIRLDVLNPLRTIEGSDQMEVTHINHGFVGGETIVVENASKVANINASDINGTRVISEIIDANTYKITVGSTATSSEDGGGYVELVTHAPTLDWTEQSFSAVRGYPHAVVFHENRLCFGGTIAEPDTIWMSKIGSFFNFDVGEAADDDAITLVAATGSVNEIRYMLSNRDLQVFTAGSELYVPTYLNQAITPTNAQIRQQTPYGCEYTQPVQMDGATLFVQNAGTVVREFLYTDDQDAYTSTAVSTIASHLIKQPRCMTVVHGAFGEAESYVAITNSDGTAAFFGSNRSERRACWVSLETENGFCSVCGVEERLFANVWDNDGNLHLCEFIGDIGLDRYVSGTITGGYLDVSAAYSVDDVVSVIGENESGRGYLGTFTVVDNGGTASVNLSGFSGFDSAYAGVAFTSKIITNPIDGNLGNGPVTGDVRGISAAILDLKDTSSVKVNGSAVVIGTPLTGKKEVRILGYSRDPQVVIEQNEPLPLQVNGLVAELIV